MKFSARLSLILSFLILTSCASLMSGNTQEVTFTSPDEEVEVYVDGEFLGKTPLTVSLNRQNDHVVEFKKDGFQNAHVDLITKINPKVYWNLPFTVVGTTGVSTDLGSGAIYQFQRSNFQVKLRKLNEKSGQPWELMDPFILVGHHQMKNEKARHQKAGEWTQTLNSLATNK